VARLKYPMTSSLRPASRNHALSVSKDEKEGKAGRESQEAA
jgi:hypothetical protein